MRPGSQLMSTVLARDAGSGHGEAVSIHRQRARIRSATCQGAAPTRSRKLRLLIETDSPQESGPDLEHDRALATHLQLSRKASRGSHAITSPGSTAAVCPGRPWPSSRCKDPRPRAAATVRCPAGAGRLAISCRRLLVAAAQRLARSFPLLTGSFKTDKATVQRPASALLAATAREDGQRAARRIGVRRPH